MTKRLYLPTHFNHETLGQEQHQLVGYTGDGHVGFTVAGIDLVNRIEISPDEADDLWRELLTASGDAKRMADEAAGLNEWVSRPLGDGRFEVRHHGHTGIFRAIVNGKRRSTRYINPSDAPRGQRCTVCRNESPEAATMYVFDRSTEKRRVYDPAASSFRHERACSACMRPDLRAAMVGAALLATTEKP